MKIILKILAPAIMTIVSILSATADYNQSGIHETSKRDIVAKDTSCSFASFPYMPIKDTIYVLGDSYLMVSLTDQLVHVHRRNDTTVTFKISSGNKNIPLGIETSTGIYTIQSKSVKAISKQFENAELFNWLGFNGNIGFHGLKGNGYYANLGKRPSSHGCIRMGREDGELMFKMVRRGTPVMVFKTDPARVFSFSNLEYAKNIQSEFFGSSGKPYKASMKSALVNLYSGDAFTLNKKKYFFDGQTSLRYGGFEEGDFEKIPVKQNLPAVDFEIVKFKTDRTFYACSFGKYSSKNSGKNAKDTIDQEIRID